MKESVDRCWLFDLSARAISSDSGAGARGLVLGTTGTLALAEDTQAAHQAILLLLSTRPGERLMRPDYGCWLHRLVFSPNDAGTAGLAIHYVGEAMRRWVPQVEILHLAAGADLSGKGDDSVLDIVLDYRIRRTLWKEHLAFGYDLHGAKLSVLQNDHHSKEGDV